MVIINSGSQITHVWRRNRTLVLAALFVVFSGLVGIVYFPRAFAVGEITPPDACFDFSGSIINYYYDNENNNPANPDCPKTVAIPATIGGVGVAGIGDSAFMGKQLTSLTLPNSVTSIGNGAFVNNKLTSLTLPDSVTSIGSAAFASNQLVSLTLPDSVTNIDNLAFWNNQLTSLTIPNSVTSIGDSAFAANQLTSVDLASGLTAIRAGTFAFNRLTDVVIPDSLTSLHPTAFAAQNPRGGSVFKSPPDPQYDFWSADPTIVQNIYSAIWYVTLHTADPSNPHNLADTAMSEDSYRGDDANANGTTRDSLGGAIINPVAVTVKYVDSHGNQLRTPAQQTGVRSLNGSLLTDYSVESSAILAPLDPEAPTTQEEVDMQAGFAQYFHIGQNRTFTAPTIAGYTTPSAQTVTLTAEQNVVTFVYQDAASPGIITTNPGVPNTGLVRVTTQVWLGIGLAAGIILVSIPCLIVLRRRAALENKT